MEFNKYVNNLLNKTNLNKKEKRDFRNELIEHLNSMKGDYLEKDFSEKDSIAMAIKNFNETNFLEELTELNTSKLTGVNISFIFQSILISTSIYYILLLINVSLFSVNTNSKIFYFVLIFFTLLVNYFHAFNQFKFKKDIISNFMITSSSFFIIEKLIMLITSKTYSLLSTNFEFSIFDLYGFSFKEILIYILISIGFIFLAKYDNRHKERKFSLHLSTIDKIILTLSLIFNALFFIYPNRLYILNLVISRLFNFTVEYFNKNIFYITINNDFRIFNIGLFLIVLFIPYKLISRTVKTKSL